MVLFRQSPSGKRIDSEWHTRRHQARTTTINLNQWSDEDIIRWNLDTAGITGRDVKRTYTLKRPYDTLGENGFDVRQLPDR